MFTLNLIYLYVALSEGLIIKHLKWWEKLVFLLVLKSLIGIWNWRVF